MTAKLTPLTPAQATREARTALGAAGRADVRRVTSRHSATTGGRLDGTVRTDVHLYPHTDRDAVADALRALPDVVQASAGTDTVTIYRTATRTVGGPTNPARLTPHEAVHRSRLIHPEWTAADHVAWLTDQGYPLVAVHGRTQAEATVAEWLAQQQTTPPAEGTPPAAGRRSR